MTTPKHPTSPTGPFAKPPPRTANINETRAFLDIGVDLRNDQTGRRPDVPELHGALHCRIQLLHVDEDDDQRRN
ncbi:hypothetical protein PM082_015726 [Marasmius tenuissimus]|nr:hypothetical protein PM082_015726 [Marasmius tenuissimus]